MTYTFDEEQTLKAFALSAADDLHTGYATLYGVICVGEEGGAAFSHGGQLTLDPIEALDSAKEANKLSGGCRYLPVALGLNPKALFTLANLVAGGLVLGEPGGEESE